MLCRTIDKNHNILLSHISPDISLKTHYEKNGKELTPLFIDFIKEMKKGTLLQKNGFVIRQSTIDAYQTLLKHLINYQINYNKQLVIKDWETLNTRLKIAETNYWKNFYFEFT